MYGKPVEDVQTVQEYTTLFQPGLNIAFKNAGEKLKHASIRQKNPYNRGIKGENFKTGNHVWILNK